MEPENFRRIRTKLGLTQADAAEVFGFSGPNVVSNIETGFRKPGRLVVSVLNLLDSLPVPEAKKLAEKFSMQNRSPQ